MTMTEWKRIPTSAEVWAVIKERHHADLKVYATFSDPDGEYSGWQQGRMETVYSLTGADYPLMEARTTWDIDQEAKHKRLNEQHEYWLCVPIKEDE